MPTASRSVTRSSTTAPTSCCRRRSRASKFVEGYAPGNGRGLVGVWEFVVPPSKAPSAPGAAGSTRRAASSSSSATCNEYGIARTGGAYRCDRPATEVVLPMPFANVAQRRLHELGRRLQRHHRHDHPAGPVREDHRQLRHDLEGRRRLAASSRSAAATGTDCTTPAARGGAGNTHATRTQFYMVNRAKEIGRGWLPSNTWLERRADRQRQPEPDLQRLLERLDDQLLPLGRRLRQHRRAAGRLAPRVGPRPRLERRQRLVRRQRHGRDLRRLLGRALHPQLLHRQRLPRRLELRRLRQRLHELLRRARHRLRQAHRQHPLDGLQLHPGATAPRSTELQGTLRP